MEKVSSNNTAQNNSVFDIEKATLPDETDDLDDLDDLDADFLLDRKVYFSKNNAD